MICRTTSSTDPNAPKLPTRVEWIQDSSVASVESVIKKTTKGEPAPPKHDSFLSVV